MLGDIEAATIDAELFGADWEAVLGTISITENADGINAPANLTVDELRAWKEASAANQATLRDATDKGSDRTDHQCEA